MASSAGPVRPGLLWPVIRAEHVRPSTTGHNRAFAISTDSQSGDSGSAPCRRSSRRRIRRRIHCRIRAPTRRHIAASTARRVRLHAKAILMPAHQHGAGSCDLPRVAIAAAQPLKACPLGTKPLKQRPCGGRSSPENPRHRRAIADRIPYITAHMTACRPITTVGRRSSQLFSSSAETPGKYVISGLTRK